MSFHPPCISAVDIGMVVIGTPSCRVSKAGIQASSLHNRFHEDRCKGNDNDQSWIELWQI